MKISVTGNSEVARKLYVLVNSYGGACSSVPAYDGGIPLANGTAIAAGLYQGEYTYTPTAIQTYTVCAYVDEEPYAKPDAMTSISFAAGRPAASISLYVNPASVENGPITITDTGSAEVPRKLYVLVNSYGGACASVPAYDGGTPLANGTSLAAGPFSGTYTYTPTSTGTYTVCGYIDEETYATPDASASVTFSNVTPSTRAKEHEEAAAKAAGEAEAAVAAKKRAEYLQGVAARGHCEQLSSGYTRADLAACEADEAAIRAGEEAVWAREAAQWAALEAVDLNKPVRSLSVSASAHPGRSSSRPGHSTLRIHTSPFAEVTIVIRRYGHRSERYHAVPASLSSSNSVIQVEYAWSCKRPGSSYRYSVIAKTHAGAALTRRGRFAPVSVARCHALELAEQQARERSQREYAERVRGEREAEEATRREGERNCRVRGGTVVELIVEGESRIGCRAPSGGLLPWIP